MTYRAPQGQMLDSTILSGPDTCHRLPHVRRTWATRQLIAMMLALSFAGIVRAEPTQTIELNLRTRTGGEITGLVVDLNDHGVVIVHDRTPYVLSWRSLEPGSEYVARRKLLEFERNGREHLSADDHFALGMIALDGGRNDMAAVEFREARDLDRSLDPRIKAAFDAFRKKQNTPISDATPFAAADNDDGAASAPASTDSPAEASTDGPAFVPSFGTDDAASDCDRYDRVIEAYRTFNEEVARVLGKSISTHETEHFLITTDRPARDLPQMSDWCEAMYAALSAQFHAAQDKPVFLAKCPIYCFRNRVRFRKFARHFDGFDARESIGYTRSIESNGHTHVVLLREGRDQADVDRFACTLVHEGTHAFLHRLFSNRLIPHWVNEGVADLVADRVLGDRCGKRADASLLAACFVRYDWSIRNMLDSTAPIGVEQYPLAHSVIRFLHERDPEGLARFIEQLKSGAPTEEALSKAYDGLALDALDKAWRAWVRASMPTEPPTTVHR